MVYPQTDQRHPKPPLRANAMGGREDFAKWPKQVTAASLSMASVM